MPPYLILFALIAVMGIALGVASAFFEGAASFQEYEEEEQRQQQL